MKYRKKTEIIDAEPYREGMEDGFITRFRDPENPNSTWGIQASDKEIPVQVPYINSVAYSKQLISTGDWILTHKNGSRSVVSNKKLQKLYEPVE